MGLRSGEYGGKSSLHTPSVCSWLVECVQLLSGRQQIAADLLHQHGVEMIVEDVSGLLPFAQKHAHTLTLQLRPQCPVP